MQVPVIVTTGELPNHISNPRNMVCFRHIIINILHKGDDDDNNNNNNKLIYYHISVHCWEVTQIINSIFCLYCSTFRMVLVWLTVRDISLFHTSPHKLLACCYHEASWREYFKILQVLPSASQYILSIDFCLIHNKDMFQINSKMHSFNIRGKSNFFQPMTNLKMCQKGRHYSGIKVYNNLPLEIRKLSDKIKLFTEVLRKFILKQSFYTLEEYFNYKPTTFNHIDIFQIIYILI